MAGSLPKLKKKKVFKEIFKVSANGHKCIHQMKTFSQENL